MTEIFIAWTPRKWERLEAMTIKKRLDKLEQKAKPGRVWNPPRVEIKKGQEDSPDHLKKLAEIKAQAEAAGWDGKSPYIIEVIKTRE